ncbi:MAG: mandelate racemase/muconate lactonizing enzyme family protein [Erythrobacter sp.]|jgi:L-alanine-DL-glutamate epimerase-like enolase superfamily enzyme|nr:mandelate racemase/muconate lactonizing enzyme family protein [Erythrobacter sp.]
MPNRRDVLMGGMALGVSAAFGPTGAIAAPAQSDLIIRELKTYRLEDALFVRLTTDSGISGWGECERGVDTVVDRLIRDYGARYVLGADPFQSTPALYDLFYAEHDALGGILAGAIAGLDIAMWDLKARILDVPLWRLLGGQYRNAMTIYGSFGVDRWTKMTPQEAVQVAEKFVDRGIETVKCRMQVREIALDPVPDRTVEYATAIHNAVGNDAEVFVDINNGYSVKRAIQVGLELRDRIGMRFYEEPCSDQNHSATKQVVDAVPMHVIAGEKEYTPFQLQELITYADPDYLNPDVIKHMGITGMIKAGTLSQVNQKPIVLHNTRPTISTAASLHLASSYPIIGPFMEYPDEDRFPRLLSVMAEPLRREGAKMFVPEGPGLGIEMIEEEVVEQAIEVATLNYRR